MCLSDLLRVLEEGFTDLTWLREAPPDGISLLQLVFTILYMIVYC
jgi:hypothetical protein